MSKYENYFGGDLELNDSDMYKKLEKIRIEFEKELDELFEKRYNEHLKLLESKKKIMMRGKD